ncbi:MULTISPECIES: hypothetical protein [unclassified Acinetobacter]|uniref:hypothetical protein n=1 Tax=unclassified Acinetobacter TaxID=196816 RepID=UPI00244AC578|nr:MULTISPECIES: hypothetical protein [unclassified Acinetobacter]MDH0030306.1 hypothetical protein [Acinetobacter sp. GD04021]MDH0885874.1 hypothetical protein [Acinetobacter sp. GD03873]MDH1082494.1 hypothetical protein [Acinetobacter sp. GD03983]MDH2189114.1 hypothetical protein [Acinetobacter sp. GD03645]MDH2202302.1 hypothetical protein [Acinetobacter sp. GD03647]
MRYRKLDENGDYSFGNSQANFYQNTPQAVGQAVLTRLRLWVGEWFLNIDDGTDWLDQVLGRGTSLLYEQVIKQRILGTQGVTEITDFFTQYDPNTRELAIQTTINTIYGETTLQESL